MPRGGFRVGAGRPVGARPDPERIQKRLEAKLERLRPRPCEKCGSDFTPYQSGRMQKFCSAECGQKAERRVAPQGPCRNCGAEMPPPKKKPRFYCEAAECQMVMHRAHKRAAYARQKASGERRPPQSYRRRCVVCDASFFASSGGKNGKKTCGAACRAVRTRQIAETRRKYLIPSRKIGTNYRRRARLYGVHYEPLDLGFIFARDKWRCQICGVSTPAKLRGGTDPQAPELDHRVPLSGGGGHTYDNVQLACRACNAAKGARKVVGQTTLFAAPTGQEIKVRSKTNASRRPSGQLGRLASGRGGQAATTGSGTGRKGRDAGQRDAFGILALFGG